VTEAANEITAAVEAARAREAAAAEPSRDAARERSWPLATIGIGVGIGSAAVAAAVLFARRDRGRR
jgi:hypothetical protein